MKSSALAEQLPELDSLPAIYAQTHNLSLQRVPPTCDDGIKESPRTTISGDAINKHYQAPVLRRYYSQTKWSLN
jgi:hypothetical protein